MMMIRSLLATAMLLATGALEAQQATRTAPPRRPAPSRPATSAAEPPMSPAIMGDDSLTMKFDVSGIPVIMRRVTANNVVAANLYLLGGARQLTPETQGIELMLLEASERGTQKYPRDVLRARMAALGSAIGVSAGADWTSVGLRATTTGLDSTWAILADRIMAPRLELADVEFVREQFATAVAQRKDSPDALLEFLSDSIAFAGHPYALEPTGTEQSYKRITAQQLRQYQNTQMVTSRMMLVVVGNVSRSKVERLVRETIGRLPRGNYAWSLPDPPADLPGAYVVEQRTLPTNYLQGYFHGPKASSSDYAALRLACAVLSGRLFGEVRQRRNLSYSVNAPFVERAFSLGGLYVTTTQPDEVLSIMLQQVKALQDGIITAEGLDQLVQQFIVTYFLDNETNADQANMLARAELYQGDFRRASRFVQELRAVTPLDIQRAARTYMRAVRWAYVGDPAKVTPARLLRF